MKFKIKITGLKELQDKCKRIVKEAKDAQRKQQEVAKKRSPALSSLTPKRTSLVRRFNYTGPKPGNPETQDGQTES